MAGKETGAGQQAKDAPAAKDGPAKAEPAAAKAEPTAAQPRPLSPDERKEEQRLAELEKNLVLVDPEKPEQAKELERRLGPPLVENADKLVRLDPVYQLYIDKPPRNVVLVGAVCQRMVPLEMFACLKGSKEHESIVVVYTKASLVHAALIACGAEPGRPVQFQPTYQPASGPEVEVTVLWKDEKGQVQKVRAQEWIRQGGTQKPMQHPWVFGGSQFRVNEDTGQKEYRADNEGYLICVSNFTAAVLDVPVHSSDANADLAFEGFGERIPPRGTPVTLVLTPKVVKKTEAGKGKAEAVKGT